MRIVVWPGSLGAASSNRAALDVAARWLERGGAEVDWMRTLDQVPPFRPEQDDQPPTPVARVRDQLQSADAVLIAAPEYAGGLAGVTKNALDWLVGSGSLYHKLAGVLTVGTTGGDIAREQLIRTLSWQGAITVASLGISSPRTRMVDGQFVDPTTIAAIEAWAADTVIANRLNHEQRLAKAAEFLNPLSIDTSRFGSGPG